MSSNLKKRYLSILQTVFFVLAWVFIAYFLFVNYPTLKKTLVLKQPGFLLLSFILTFPCFYLLLLIRNLLTRAMNLNVSWQDNFYIYAHNGILKYLPGGIWNQIDAAMMLENKAAVSLVKTSKLVFIEMYWRVVTGYFFFGWGLFALKADLLIPNLEFLYLLSLSLIVGFTFYFNRQHRGLCNYHWQTFLRHLFLNLLYWFFFGFSVIFLISAFESTSWSFANLNYLIAGNAISWIAGFLFIPAPSGLGVRELVLSLFLEKINIILTLGFSLSLIERLVLLVRDVLLYIYARITTKLP